MPHTPTSLFRPAGLLALAICLGFPFAFDLAFPAHEGVPRAVVLGPLRAGHGIELPSWQIEATLLAEAADDVSTERLYAFDSEEAGRFTLEAIADFDGVALLEISLNGRAVAAAPLGRPAGTPRALARKRVAPRVELERGRNEILLRGPFKLQKWLVLELRRETPLSLPRFLALAAGMALLLLLRRVVVHSATLSPGARLVATTGFFALFVLGPPIALAVHDGSRIVALDQADRRKRVRLAELELYLASAHHAGSRDAYRVALLGDSTHFWPQPKHERMLPVLQRTLAERGIEDVAVFGISAGAFSSYDFYLLLCRLIDDPPDLVVVPVNLRSFSERWHRLRDHDFPRIEGYLPLSELVHGHGLTLGPRFLRWDRLLRIRLDGWWFDGDAGAFQRGLKRWLQAQRERMLDAFGGGDAGAVAQEPPTWPESVTADNPTLEPFRRLNDLAARHGVRVLYYSVQANERAQARRGVDLQLQRHYRLIRSEIGEDPGVTFLHLARSNPKWTFADDFEHLSTRGVESVAGHLADAIDRLRRDAP